MTPTAPPDFVQALLDLPGRLDVVVQALQGLHGALAALAEAQTAREHPGPGEPSASGGAADPVEAVAAALDAHLFPALQQVVALEVAQGIERVLQALGGLPGGAAAADRPDPGPC